MFKKFYTFLNNMKVRNKLIVIFGVMGIIPMLVIMVVSSYIMSDILRDKEEQILRTRLKQVAYSVEAELVTYNSLSSYISFNEIMANVFAAEYDDSNELIKRITNIIKPQLETVAYFGDSVKKTILYVDCIEDAVEEKIIPLAEVENEYWYKNVCKDEKNHWYVDREENIAFCVRKSAVLRKKNIQGLFYLSIDCAELFEGLTYNMGTNYGIFVVDSNDNLA